MNDQFMTIDSKVYSVSTQTNANVVDSFVLPVNKSGKANGEARLYVAPQNSEKEAFFTFSNTSPISKGNHTYAGCKSKCFIEKDNLIKYMEDARIDYMFPKVKYHSNVSLAYDERCEMVNKLPSFSQFAIYNQKGTEDTSRFYLGSTDPAWKLLREISLPKITSLTIFKLESILDEQEIAYFFQLKFDSAVTNVSASQHTLTKISLKKSQTIRKLPKLKVLQLLKRGSVRENSEIMCSLL